VHDAAQWCFQGAQNDGDTGVLVMVVELPEDKAASGGGGGDMGGMGGMGGMM